jgi:hypothetical protein
MRRLFARCRSWQALLAGAAWVAFALPGARGQNPIVYPPAGYGPAAPGAWGSMGGQVPYNPYPPGAWAPMPVPQPSPPYDALPLPPVEPIYGPQAPPRAPQPNQPGYVTNPQATVPGWGYAQTYAQMRRPSMMPVQQYPFPTPPPVRPVCLPPPPMAPALGGPDTLLSPDGPEPAPR